jgi:hypothetical protein
MWSNTMERMPPATQIAYRVQRAAEVTSGCGFPIAFTLIALWLPQLTRG